MRKIRIVALLLIVSLLLIPGSALAEEREGLVYLALGDSLAYGTGASISTPYPESYVIDPGYIPPGYYGYTDRLNGHLENVFGPGEYYNYSYNGFTSDDLLAMLEDYPIFAAEAGVSDIITISVGGNDLLKPALDLVAADPNYLVPGYFETQYALNPRPAILDQFILDLTIATTMYGNRMEGILLELCQERGTTADIFILNLYNPFAMGTALHDFAEPFINSMNYQLVTAQYNLGPEGINFKIVDVKDAFAEYNNKMRPLVHSLSSPVAVHPTDRGYQLIYHLHKKQLDIKELLD